MRKVLSSTRIVMLVFLAVVALGGWGARDLEAGDYTVNAGVPFLEYESMEILHVPYGDNKPGIPRHKQLTKRFEFPNGSRDGYKYFEGLTHLKAFNVTDDGWFLLATGGPLDSHRWIYVFSDDGRLVWQVRHREPWFNSIDIDDQGRVILFVVTKDEYEISKQGYVELHRADRKAYVAFYDSKGGREVLQTPQFRQEDAWTADQHGWSMRSPFHYAGKLYAGSDIRCDLKKAVPNKRRSNKPMLYQMYAKGSGSRVRVGKKKEVRAYIRDERDRSVKVYSLELPKGSATSAKYIGGEKQSGYFFRVWIDTGSYTVGQFIKSGYKKILKLNYRGQVEGQLDIKDPRYATGSLDYVDLKGRIFQCLTSGPAIRQGGVTVVRWAPVESK